MQPTNNRQPKTQKAFTLIELLVVIAIIGILAGMVVVNMSGATESARVAKAKAFSNSIRSSLLMNRVSEWNFNETSGTATADTVGTNSGVLNNFNFGSADGWRSGSSCVSDGCLQFDGSDDYVSLGSDPSLYLGNAFSISAWFYLNNDLPASGWSNWLYNGGVQPGMYFDGKKLRFYSYHSGWDDLNSSSDIVSKKWNHVAVVWNGSIKYIYLNGQMDVSRSNANVQTAGTGTKYIGQYTSSWYFNGLIDETRVYNSALPSSAIREQYVAGLHKLLAKEQITDKDYQQRLTDLNLTYAIEK